jgi:hypothetical protein
MPLSPDLPADDSSEADSPAYLTPDERRRQVAAILARGVLRLRSSGRLPSNPAASAPADLSSKSRQKALEVSAHTSPHATRG